MKFNPQPMCTKVDGINFDAVLKIEHPNPCLVPKKTSKGI
jgi:hypothetical protein